MADDVTLGYLLNALKTILAWVEDYSRKVEPADPNRLRYIGIMRSALEGLEATFNDRQKDAAVQLRRRDPDPIGGTLHC